MLIANKAFHWQKIYKNVISCRSVVHSGHKSVRNNEGLFPTTVSPFQNYSNNLHIKFYFARLNFYVFKDFKIQHIISPIKLGSYINTIKKFITYIMCHNISANWWFRFKWNFLNNNKLCSAFSQMHKGRFYYLQNTGHKDWWTHKNKNHKPGNSLLPNAKKFGLFSWSWTFWFQF